MKFFTKTFTKKDPKLTKQVDDLYEEIYQQTNVLQKS